MRSPSRAAPRGPGRVTAVGLDPLGLGPVGLAVAALWLGACTEQPSYQLSWKFYGAAETPDAELTHVNQCSEIGVSKVRLTTLVGGADLCTGVTVDEREYNCADPDVLAGGLVDGPVLEPGEYTVLVQGLRRSGEPWPCSADDSPACAEPESSCYARSSVELSVSEGATETAELALLAPPQCDDGIDNDRDGRVDDRDTACLLSAEANPEGLESAEKGLTLFQLRTRFLTHPLVEPVNVNVETIRLETRASDVSEFTPFTSIYVDSPTYGLDTSKWPFGFPLLSGSFAPGVHELRATAYDGAGVALTEGVHRTINFGEAGEAELLDFSAPEENFVIGEFVFSSERFLEPIVAPVAFGVQLDTATLLASCAVLPFGQLLIDRVWIRVRDELGAPLDAASLGLAGLDAVDELDGFVSIACPTVTVESLPLSWGAYSVEIEARIGDDVCFATGAQDLAPFPGGGSQSILLPRSTQPDGTPAPNCVECVVDDDCLSLNTTYCSEEGLCLPKESSGG